MSTQTQDQNLIWASYEDFCTLDATRHPEHDVVAELEVENTTPTMIGDWQGHHHVRLEGLDSNCDDRQHCHIPTLLTAKPLIGKMRWLLKRLIILAGLADDLKQAETAIKILVARPGRRTPHELGLVEFLFGKIGQSSKDTSWTAAYVIQVVPKYNIASLDKLAYKFLSKEGYLRYISNRYRLITITKKSLEEKTKLLPLKPGTIKANIFIRKRKSLENIHVRAENNQQLENESIWRILNELMLLLVYATISYIGIGKASTRGFGRFRATRITLVDVPSNVLNTAHFGDEIENPQHYIASVFNRIIEILMELNSGDSNGNIDFTDFVDAIDVSWLPRDVNVNMYARHHRVLQYILASNEEQSLEIALIELIALSTLKKTWRQIESMTRCRGDGQINIIDVIWIMGLPRSVPISRECSKIKVGYNVLKRHIITSHVGAGLVTQNNVNVYEDRIRLNSHIIIFPILNENEIMIILLKFPLIYSDVSRLMNEISSQSENSELVLAYLSKISRCTAKIKRYVVNTFKNIVNNNRFDIYCNLSKYYLPSNVSEDPHRNDVLCVANLFSLCVSSEFIRNFLEGR